MYTHIIYIFMYTYTYIYTFMKVSADSRVPFRLFSFGTLAIVVGTRPRALALHLLRAFLRSGIPEQDTTAFALCD